MSTTTIKYTSQERRDILVTALEGGINYWVSSFTDTQRDTEGYYTSVSLTTFESGTIHHLTPDTIQAGADRLLADTDMGLTAADIRDPDNVDAELADIIIQYALFGELVYS